MENEIKIGDEVEIVNPIYEHIPIGSIGLVKSVENFLYAVEIERIDNPTPYTFWNFFKEEIELVNKQKFQIGDKVVVSNPDKTAQAYKDVKGVVTKYNPTNLPSYPYGVTFIHNGSETQIFFNVNELDFDDVEENIVQNQEGDVGLVNSYMLVNDSQTEPEQETKNNEEYFVERAIADLVLDELLKATEKHGKLSSAHEGYAIILEELDELWEHVKMKQSERNNHDMLEEAIQVAAMAMKFIRDCT